MVDSSQAQCAGAACVGLITKGIVFHGLNCGLIICRARDSSGLHARCWRSGRNTSACWKIDLGWCCAIQTTLLAPSKQASSLAIFEAIVCSRCVTLGARSADANGASQAAVELVMVDSSQAQCAGTACVGLITKGIVIHGLNCGLIICRARDSSGLHARCWRSGRNTSARWKIDLGWCCAIQTTLLAPSKQAGSLAIFEAIVCSRCVTLGARSADANGAS